MPWKEPGKGDKDPWNSGGQQPPDLEEVFRNVNNRLRSIFGGGGGGKRKSDSSGSGGIFGIVLVALVLWAGFDSVHIVDEAEQGVVLRFGKYNRTLSPGINLTLPRPFETMTTVNVSSVRSLEDRGNMLTEDENLVEFVYKVQYRVAIAQDFLFNVRDPELTVKQAAESALRESVGTNRLDAILEGTQRETIRIETQRVLQETLDRYAAGIMINEFNLEDVNVPAQVREAYSDVIRAREDRERFIEEARVHANSVVPEARGQAARVIEEGEGYKASTVALAEGEARRFNLLLLEYLKAPEITRKRLYLQTMENVFARSQKVLLDAQSGGNILYLPLNQLGGANSGQALLPPVLTPDSGPVGENQASSRTSRREGRQ
ncbi:MAG: FtsH protease activity modulator HflK [Xanthomonadales bacterium]|nr:FtsH protease activity modulator HflK [Gammaproteobacteria bacterium]MBT8054369.1 FtsH protease activity modulator HflK [Gammaproteobacteria bacterium]NND56467.1 FtsH protease activity modulator HflK [Xanthomonadales bacterium]NNK51162.1 FtsH protease activity modulator HflK [Xanthomonadales bacterium]